TANTNAKNGQDLMSVENPFATTVTLHSREATSDPSDTVTFTVWGPGAAEAKFNALAFPPATTLSTRQVYVSRSPSGSHAMIVNVCVALASTITGPSPGVLEVICGARSPTVIGRVVLFERPRSSATVRRTPKIPLAA